jgi:RNA recognition motif-containing protein
MWGPPTNLISIIFATLEELREHFHAYGEIESINVKTDPNTGRSRGFAFIVFSQADSIDKVCALDKLYNWSWEGL